MTKQNSHKKVLVFFCGLAGVGKRTLIDELRKQLPNTAKFEKDLLSDNILAGLDHTTPEYMMIKDRIYTTLAMLAIDNLKNSNTTAILQAYYGDKLTKPGTVEYITSQDYEVKIVYVHCSGKKQLTRLKDRGAARDNDKIDYDSYCKNKFNPYRLIHIKNHLRELAQVSDCLILDTENDLSLESNVAKIIEYINTPTSSIEIKTILNKDGLDAVTLNESLGGYSTFLKLLGRIQPGHSALIMSNETTEESFIPTLRFTKIQAATGVLGLIALGTSTYSYANSDYRNCNAPWI